MSAVHGSPRYSRSLKKFFGPLLAALLSGHTAPATPADVPAPPIAAPAWLLMDHDSGQVLAEHNADKPRAPGSLAKLMTAYVLFGKLKAGTLRPDDPITVSQRAWNVQGARLFLRPGTRASAQDLLQGMIVLSANDAAVALAEHVAGNEADFVAEMNAVARKLDLAHTAFTNVTGHDDRSQHSTARDLSRLASALIRDFPEYHRWFALREFTYQEIKQYNRNALLWRDPSVDGVKTGQTRSAGFCLIASAKRDGMRLIATVLGARDENTRVTAGQQLLDHGFRHFETRLLYARDVPAARVRVWMGDQSALPVGVRRDLYLTLPRGRHEKLRARLTLEKPLYAPVRAGQTVGTLALDLDRQPFAEYPLVALEEIGKGNLFQRALDRMQLWLQ